LGGNHHEEELVHRSRGYWLGLLPAVALTLGALSPAATLGKKGLPEYRAVEAPAAIRNSNPDRPHRVAKSASAKRTAHAMQQVGGNPTYQVGDPIIGVSQNTATQGFFATTYHVVAMGDNIEVWVQDNLAFPAGDPRPTPVVTDAQIAYLIDQFDNNIYPKESEFWRTPLTRDGTNAQLDDIFGLPEDSYVSADGKDRVIALITNIRDENFVDPEFPVYTGGYFSGTINSFFDRNVITIDAFDWANRVGPNDSPWRDSDPSNDIPFQYEGTFAHEYQHLLHRDQDPNEVNWVNEGLSDWTEFLVGYGIPAGHWDTAQEFAENSLTVWGDQGNGEEILADYGEAFMFFHYVYRHFGEEVMHAIFENLGTSIAGVNAALDESGVNKDFEEIYHDFAVARLVLAKGGVYSLPDIPSPVVLNDEAFSTPGAPPWGSDYISVDHPKQVKSISFNGVDLITRDTAWTSVEDPLDAKNMALWSGTGDEQDRFAIFETTGGGTLSFDTLYDLEEQWDFGFVEVSTDGGATWKALTNEDTRDDIVPEGYPAIKDELANGGQGFTGVTDGWVHESFDLSGYSGSILVGFRWMSDWGTNGNGVLDDPNWYVDNVAVDDTVISDGSNASEFKDVTFYQPIDVDFNVDLVSLSHVGSIHNSSFKVLHLITDDVSETASAAEIRQALRNSNVLVAIVTYDAPLRERDYAPYELTFGN
jgi:immune inhibitor A